MKILIISRTPWNISNSFGNTFSNLFEGITDMEIYHICCQHGATQGSPALKTFQMSDRSVMKSILFRKRGVGWLTDNGNNCLHKENDEISKTAAKKKNPIAYYVRDFIWTLGAWRQDVALNDFLEEINPDVLYLPIYASCYMCDIQQYIVEKMSVPCVGHISDDVFAVLPGAPMLIKHYTRKVGKKLRRIIEHCAYLEVFAESMQRSYAVTYQKPVFLIGKGINVDILPNVYPAIDRAEKHFVYTGNISEERYRTLLMIGEALCEQNGKKNGVLDIYSATELTTEMKAKFDSCRNILFHGAVPASDIPNIQAAADVLVHVEGFSPIAITSTRMSFSTKLIDYMMSGNLIFAVGDSEINSIEVLSKYQLAVIAESAETIGAKIHDIMNDRINLNQIRSNVERYLFTFRNRQNIQKGIKERLDSLICSK